MAQEVKYKVCLQFSRGTDVDVEEVATSDRHDEAQRILGAVAKALTFARVGEGYSGRIEGLYRKSSEDGWVLTTYEHAKELEEPS